MKTSVKSRGYLLVVKCSRSLGRSIRLIMTVSGLREMEGRSV